MKEISVIGHENNSYSLSEIPASKIFSNLKCIILINVGLTWKTFFKISSSFHENVEELILCKNDLSDIENIDEKKVNEMKELTFLNLEETKQTCFDGINKFNGLKKL